MRDFTCERPSSPLLDMNYYTVWAEARVWMDAIVCEYPSHVVLRRSYTHVLIVSSSSNLNFLFSLEDVLFTLASPLDSN